MLKLKSILRSKWTVLSISLVLLLTVGTGAVLSYISDSTPDIDNHLVPGIVQCEVESVLNENVRTDVSVKNTGNTSAYIRTAVVVNWQSLSDGNEILAREPAADVDYEMVFANSIWQKGDDGFWYYPDPIEPEANTGMFIEKISPIGEAPDGYSLSVEILAEAIQANPTYVVENEWGVTAVGNLIQP